MLNIVPISVNIGFFNSRIARPGMQKTVEHTINEYQLEFCDTDGGVTYIDDVAYPVRKNMIICAKPGQRRWTRLPFCCYYIKIGRDEAAFKSVLDGMKDAWITTPEIMELFLQSFHRLTESIDISEMRYYSSLFSLLVDVAEDSNKSEQRKELDTENDKNNQAERAVRYAKEYIDTHFSDKCALEDIAKQAGFSPIYFHAMFKRIEGMTPNEYLLRRRLLEARERLTTGNLSLCEIAFQCGFGSQSYFQYVFKKECGMTPTAFRKNQQQKYLS